MTVSCISGKTSKSSDGIRFSHLQKSETGIMLSFGTVWVLLFALLSSAVLDNYCEIVPQTLISKQDSTPPGYSEKNCSATYPKSTVVHFDITQFVGDWNYVQLYTAKPLLTDPSCMRLVATLEDQKLIMDVEILRVNDKRIHSSVFAFVDDEVTSGATWNLYSHFSMAASKWIVLSSDENLTLYLICGDYSDGTSAVGEIGILSRHTHLSIVDSNKLRKILHRNGSLDKLGFEAVSHADCNWVEPR